MPRSYENIVGRKFGRLLVEEREVVPDKRGAFPWRCRCDCGVVKSALGPDLRSGRVVSCGCLKRERVGGLNSRETDENGAPKCSTCGRSDVVFYNRGDRHSPRSQCVRCGAAATRERKYGITAVVFRQMLAGQNHRCAICSCALDEDRARVDHCHVSGRVRGLLCTPCNSGIGGLADLADNCRAAARYLDSPVTFTSKGIPVRRTQGSGRLSGYEYHLRHEYAVTLADLEAAIERQGGKCAICGQEPKVTGRRAWHVDHDHATGQLRGALCRGCNMGLGSLRDSKDLCFAAAQYLERGVNTPDLPGPGAES